MKWVLGLVVVSLVAGVGVGQTRPAGDGGAEVRERVKEFYEHLKKMEIVEAKEMVVDVPGTRTSQQLAEIGREVIGKKQEITAADVKEDGEWAFVVLGVKGEGGGVEYETGPMVRVGGKWFVLMSAPTGPEGKALDEGGRKRIGELARWARDRAKELRGEVGGATSKATSRPASRPSGEAGR